MRCERHRDGNDGVSWIVWLGDCTGGARVFGDGRGVEEKYTWHAIDGQIPHWNEPREGTKYSISIYQSESDKKKTNNINKQTKKTNSITASEAPLDASLPPS